MLVINPCRAPAKNPLTRIIHELVLRDCEDGRTTGQPQGLEFEAYLNGTSQGEPVLPVPSVVSGSLSKEHPRTPGRAFKSTVGVANS